MDLKFRVIVFPYGHTNRRSIQVPERHNKIPARIKFLTGCFSVSLCSLWRLPSSTIPELVWLQCCNQTPDLSGLLASPPPDFLLSLSPFFLSFLVVMTSVLSLSSIGPGTAELLLQVHKGPVFLLLEPVYNS